MHLLRRPRLALLFAGGALNQIGSWASLIALWGFAAFHFHSSPAQVALIGLAWTVPGAVFSVASGWPIDRFGPRATLVAANVVGGAAALAMAASSTYRTLVLLAVLAGTAEAFGRPAGMSLPPRIVADEDLLAANALMGMSEQSAIVFGPLVASAAIAGWGLRAAFLVDAATFVAGIAALLPLRMAPLPAGTPGPSAPADLTAGFRLAWRVADIRRTLLLAMVVFCSWGAFVVIEPLYVRDVLHRSPVTLGYLQTVFGVGLLGMTALLPRLGDRVVSVRALAVSALASGGAAALYVGTRYLPVAMAGVFLWGVVTGFFMPPMQTLLQRSAPVETHGRLMAAAGTVNGVANLVAIPAGGLLIGLVGVSGTGMVVGALLVAAGAAGWRGGQARLNSSSSAAASAG
ncbi:MAG TPA: MFS transporter [Acidimicrobiales bacterium]|nr:MFS transporter [Acidimicrobiales bacterium]